MSIDHGFGVYDEDGIYGEKDVVYGEFSDGVALPVLEGLLLIGVKIIIRLLG